MFDDVTVQDAAKRWEMSERRIQKFAKKTVLTAWYV